MIRSAAWAISFCLLATAGIANAEERGTPSAIRVFVAGPPEAVVRTRATVRELFSRIHLDAIVEPATDETALANAPSDVAARAFFDFRSLASPRVVLSPRAGNGDVERRMLPASSSLEVSVEEAAHILYSAVESSQNAREPSAAAAAATATAAASAPNDTPSAPGTAEAAQGNVSSAAPLRGATKPSPARPESPRTDAAKEADDGELQATSSGRADTGPVPHAPGTRPSALQWEGSASAFGGFSSFSADHVLPGVGGTFDVAFGAARLRPGAAVSIGAFLPSTVTRDTTTGEVRAESVRLLATAEWAPWQRAGVACGVGGGVDRVTFEAGAGNAAVASLGTTTRVDPVLESSIEARIHLFGAFGAFALAAADVDLAPHQYVTDANGQTKEFFTLPRVRPTAALGIRYVFHEARRAAVSEASR